MSDFLGGISLGSPAQRVEATLRGDLELRRKTWDRPGYVYRGSADLLLQHGRFYSGRALPDEYAHLGGAMSACFLNALLACEQDDALLYCEGVYTTGYGSPRAHAWCVAPDGGVVEVTFPTDAETLREGRGRHGMNYLPPPTWGYFGAAFSPALVRRHLIALDLPMLDRSAADVRECLEAGLDLTATHDFPLLKVPYDPTRTEVP